MQVVNLAEGFTGPSAQLQQVVESQARTKNYDLQGQKLGIEIEQQKMALQDEMKFRQYMQQRMARMGTPTQPGQAPRDGMGVLSSQQGVETPKSPISQAESYLNDNIQLASELAAGGMYARGNELVSKTLSDMSHLSTAQSNFANQRLRTLEYNHKTAESVHRLTAGIKDQASFDRARMVFMEENPGAPLPAWTTLPYEAAKPYIEQLKNFSKEGMEAAKTQAEIERTKAQTVEQRTLANLNSLRAKLEKMELDAQRERADLARKNGEPLPSVKHPNQSGTKISAAERLNADQMIRAGNELFTGFDEIMKLKPGTSMGTFADLAYAKDPGFISGAKKWLANKITTDESHQYAARLAGVNVAAAIIASGGRAPRVSQMEAEQAAIAELSGQSRYVFYDKIHQATLKALRGIDITRPGDEQQKNNLELVKERLKSTLEQTEAAMKVMKKGGKEQTGRITSSYGTLEEAQAAAAAGTLKAGTRVKIGDQEGTWE